MPAMAATQPDGNDIAQEATAAAVLFAPTGRRNRRKSAAGMFAWSLTWFDVQLLPTQLLPTQLQHTSKND
jgi:hypothetical protein